MTKTNKYTLNEIQSILSNGFDFVVPEETLQIISQIASQVGSDDYVKTPIFNKSENLLKNDNIVKKNKRTRNVDDNWKTNENFQTTKIKEREGINLTIDAIRTILYKLTDKNYLEMSNKIHEIIDKLLDEKISSEDLSSLSSNIFDIVSTNNFSPKLYADLFSELINKYSFIKEKLENNFKNFIDLFNNIEYVDSDVDYDKFCDINKMNEKRKLLAAFYFNLMLNGIIPHNNIVQITRNLLFQIYSFISLENKKNEVDELTETIASLYRKDIYENDTGDAYEKIDGCSISELITKISGFKVKDYKSLTNKSLFKFMDLVEM
jgi:hypothetical protein